MIQFLYISLTPLWDTVGLLVITITVNTYIIFIDVLSRTVCSRWLSEYLASLSVSRSGRRLEREWAVRLHDVGSNRWQHRVVGGEISVRQVAGCRLQCTVRCAEWEPGVASYFLMVRNGGVSR